MARLELAATRTVPGNGITTTIEEVVPRNTGVEKVARRVQRRSALVKRAYENGPTVAEIRTELP